MPRTARVSTACSSDASGVSGRRTRSRRRSCARLRAYDDLRHAEQLGAWVATIAERVAIDVHRRAQAPVEGVEENVWDSRPAYAELEHLSALLPATERAAVVLRYGYELDYDQIGEVLGSNAVAARQAASAGVRRLRKELA